METTIIITQITTTIMITMVAVEETEMDHPTVVSFLKLKSINKSATSVAYQAIELEIAPISTLTVRLALLSKVTNPVVLLVLLDKIMETIILSAHLNRAVVCFAHTATVLVIWQVVVTSMRKMISATSASSEDIKPITARKPTVDSAARKDTESPSVSSINPPDFPERSVKWA
jgi:hypothetical protein